MDRQQGSRSAGFPNLFAIYKQKRVRNAGKSILGIKCNIRSGIVTCDIINLYFKRQWRRSIKRYFVMRGTPPNNIISKSYMDIPDPFFCYCAEVFPRGEFFFGNGRYGVWILVQYGGNHGDIVRDTPQSNSFSKMVVPVCGIWIERYFSYRGHRQFACRYRRSLRLLGLYGRLGRRRCTGWQRRWNKYFCPNSERDSFSSG